MNVSIIDLTEDPITSTKKASSVHDVNCVDPPFGSRFLVDPSLTFTQNAWDHVPPPVDQGATIATSLARQRAAVVSEEERLKLNSKPAKYWDNFYKNNEANFFKNRKWLHNEFPDLVAAAEPGAGSVKIAEFGCGAGNSIFPVLSVNQNPQLELYAYDYSNHAVKLVQHNPLYASPPCGSIHSAVWDLSSDDSLPPGLAPASVDIVILVFVLSALHPDEWASAIRNLRKVLKPGTGKVLFRDYGRYDLTQLRFKSGRMMGDNFYKRGDGTRVYFFELDELSLLFTGQRLSKEERDHANLGTSTSEVLDGEDDDGSIGAGSITTVKLPKSSPELTTNSQNAILPSPFSQLSVPPSTTDDSTKEYESPSENDAEIHPNLLNPSFPFLRDDVDDTSDIDDHNNRPLSQTLRHRPLFTIANLGIDRRLIVNRKRQLKMYRVWMQGIFRRV
ncbi:methyltransferase [Lentinula edodes]|uniref:Actin binding protein n=1 Tax=Lentinula edodes TaxID=5353 RepID=A0A1Q3ELV2_LENED|nr:methyltransferase [Lentinula edodes]GAW08182.1 actin binding protein [Lentinula edodes]